MAGEEAGREDDLASFREGGGIPGYSPDGGQRHAEGEILENEVHVFPPEVFDEFLQHRILTGIRSYGGSNGALTVPNAADMAFDELGEPLEQRLFRRVAGGSAVEFAEQAEPVQR